MCCEFSSNVFFSFQVRVALFDNEVEQVQVTQMTKPVFNLATQHMVIISIAEVVTQKQESGGMSGSGNFLTVYIVMIAGGCLVSVSTTVEGLSTGREIYRHQPDMLKYWFKVALIGVENSDQTGWEEGMIIWDFMMVRKEGQFSETSLK